MGKNKLKTDKKNLKKIKIQKIPDQQFVLKPDPGAGSRTPLRRNKSAIRSSDLSGQVTRTDVR